MRLDARHHMVKHIQPWRCLNAYRLLQTPPLFRDRLSGVHVGRQVLAQSRKGDRDGAGRGDDWPSGAADEIAWARDFGTRALDRTTGVFNADHGRAKLQRQIGDSACEL